MALLACDVFASELAPVLAGAAHVAEVRMLEIALHDRPDVMRSELQSVLDGWAGRADIQVVALAYGLCGCGTAGLVARGQPLVIPRAHDCRPILLGDGGWFEERARTCPGCFYYSPGWNRARRVPGPGRLEALREEFSARFDPEDVAFLLESECQVWASYDTAAFIDQGLPEAAEELAYTRRCAEALGLRFEHLQGDPAWLRDLVWGPWDGGRFQVVVPGGRLAHATDGRILKSEPPADLQ